MGSPKAIMTDIQRNMAPTQLQGGGVRQCYSCQRMRTGAHAHAHQACKRKRERSLREALAGVVMILFFPALRLTRERGKDDGACT